MMKQMMNSMMGVMMDSMRPDEKQDTMLKMVPEMLDHVSMLDLFNILKKLFPTLLQGVNTVAELLPKLAEMMPAMMERMMPVMEVMMPSIMREMMPMMMTAENMTHMETFPERMLPKMLEDEHLRRLMPDMMSKILPYCLEQMLPYLAEEKKTEFITTIQHILENKEDSL